MQSGSVLPYHELLTNIARRGIETVVFPRLLIANRGEIACRIIATCRNLGIRSIAVYSEIDAASPHVQTADEAICLGPAPARASYLNQAALLHALESSHADAVHPGYGFLSESAAFAAAVESAGRVFVGPSVKAIAFLSDKIQARKHATQLGLPPVPGLVRHIDDMAHEDWLRMAEELGFPLLVKAAAGGGGIGMQCVANIEELAQAQQSSARSAERSFGDGRIYLERYLDRPRHVELQLLRNSQGTTSILGSRECSVQRRFQKLIEECPSPTYQSLPAQHRVRIESFARQLLQSVEYIGVATLELLVDQDQNAYFLEVNARLQVEHTVTEQVFGVDLVEEQLRLAANLDFSEALKSAAPSGHAIEARVYAESPARAFMPQPGTVEMLHFPESEAVRVDHGIAVGSLVSPHYDSLLAKLIAWAPQRTAATRALVRALIDTQIVVKGKQGIRDNNLALLRHVLESRDWAVAAYDTGVVGRILPLFHRKRVDALDNLTLSVVG